MNSPEPSQDPQGPDHDLEALERRLAGLRPSPPKFGAVHRLGMRLDAMSADRSQNRRLWWRLAPVAAAACLVFTGGHLLKTQLTDGARQAAASPPLMEPDSSLVEPAIPASFVSPPPIRTGIPSDHFMPVSSQDYLRSATEGGVVEMFDRQPAREIRVEYDSSWHWHDPETQTNVRVYRPREEIILVPIETD